MSGDAPGAGGPPRDEEQVVAEAIEEAIDTPVSIEEEAELEAAGIEELEAGVVVADAPPVEDDPPPDRPGHPLLDPLADDFPSVSFEMHDHGVGPVQAVAHVPADDLVGFMTAARDAGYRMFVDLCAVDYLRRRPRFEVVIQVLSLDPPHRLRVRTGVEGADPAVASITAVYPGANFYEREAYDLFGIRFDGHPDLTRILLPDDWEGHPLRKDYAVGSVPVQFKEAFKAP